MQIMRGKHMSLIAGLGVGSALALLFSQNRDTPRRSRDLTSVPQTDHLLAARVCAELDQNVEHPRAIQVFAHDNNVTLRGIVLRNELKDVLTTTRSVSGVRAVRSELDLRDSVGKVLSLQS